jgi:hypothetical protein
MSDLKEFQTGAGGDPFNGAVNGTVGATTPATGAFTTLSASSTATLNTLSSSGATITGGSINGTTVGASTASTGAFTTLGASGVATFSAGTVSAPSITTTGDTNTGIFFPAADTIAFTEGGVEAMRINSSGNLLVGYTADQGSGKLQVNGAGRIGAFDFNTADLTYVGGETFTTGTFFGTAFAFKTSNVERARITSSGNFIIGATAGDALLTVNGNIQGVAENSAFGFDSVFSAASLGFIKKSGANPVIASSTGQPIIFSQTNQSSVFTNISTATITERMRIDSSGNVGIGTSSPAYRLTVAGASTAGSVTALAIENPSTNGASEVRQEWRAGGTTFGYISVSYNNNAAYMALSAGGAESMRITNSGNLGLGVTPSAWSGVKAIQLSNNSSAGIGIYGAGLNEFGAVANTHYNGTNWIYSTTTTSARYAITGGQHQWFNAPSGTAGNAVTFTQTMTLNASGNLGVGTTSPAARLDVQGSTGFVAAAFKSSYATTGYIGSDTSTFWFGSGGSAQQNNAIAIHPTSNYVAFYTNAANERMRIDSSGNVGIGITNPNTELHVQGAPTTDGSIVFNEQLTATTAFNASPQSGTMVSLKYNTGGDYAGLGGWSVIKENAADGNFAGAMLFHTRANGGAITERMRIDSSGNLLFNSTSNDQWYTSSNAGITLQTGNFIAVARSGGSVFIANRLTNDGDVIEIKQAGTLEGSISVSGTTVSYNGGHLARWSQLLDGSKDESLLKGTVLSNLDEMCVWEKDGVVAENQQLNKMKVSDVEGDTNVAGVFVNWTKDEDYNSDDMNIAMTGDMIIRIAEGVTVQRGDLLMSAGDGTAKPQGDDIVRSKTIAKVTSTNITCTYADGSYCVPCVLMAC